MFGTHLLTIQTILLLWWRWHGAYLFSKAINIIVMCWSGKKVWFSSYGPLNNHKENFIIFPLLTTCRGVNLIQQISQFPPDDVSHKGTHTQILHYSLIQGISQKFSLHRGYHTWNIYADGFVKENLPYGFLTIE